MTGKRAISRTPRWLSAAALALGIMDPAREKPAPRPRDDVPTDLDLESQLERDDAALLAHMREAGQLHSNLEAEAGDREIKRWLDDDEHYTMADRIGLHDDVTRGQMVGDGFVRAFNAAEQQAAVMERAMLHIRLGRRACPEMMQLAQIAQQMREQGHET